MFNKTDVIRKLIPLCSRLCQIGYLKPGWIRAKIGLTILAKNEVKLYSTCRLKNPFLADFRHPKIQFNVPIHHFPRGTFK